MNRKLDELVKRVERWPEPAQEELAELADEIDRELAAGSYGTSADAYVLTDADKIAIEEGLAAAREGRFATTEEVAAVFAKYRRR
jgi:predicted transcriptional regulator